MKALRTTPLILTLVVGLASTVAWADDACSNASLRGSYGFLITGSIVVGPFAGPVAVTGVATFDGAGNFTRVERSNFNGNPFPLRTITGTYVVAADCTVTVNDDDGRSSFGVLVDKGAEGLAIGVDTNPPAVLTVTLKKVTRSKGQ